MKRSWKTLLASALILALALTGCGNAGTSGSGDSASGTTNDLSSAVVLPEERAANSDIVIAVDSDMVTLDPADATDTLGGAVQRMMMDGLFYFDAEMNVINMLATGYEASDDATEYTITLREGISFTDGTPWNADAAKANLDRLGDQSQGLKRNGLFAMLDTTEVIDEYTIKITLQYSFGAFINTLAHPAGAMMSPVQLAAGNAACATHPVGTGQYKFVNWQPGDHWKLELNEDWWGYDAEICGGTPIVPANAGFSTMTFKPVLESATRVAMVQSGDADFIYPVPTESFAMLEADPNVNAISDESVIMRYLYINTHKPALSDIRVRQALNHAINKEAFGAVVLNGLASPASSYMAPAVQFYQEQTPYEYSVEKAKALLADAGYADGLTLKVLTANDTTSIKACEFIQQQLAEVGITLQLTPMEQATLNTTATSYSGPAEDAPYDFVYQGWSPSTGDADWVLRAVFSETLSPPNGNAFSFFSNEDYNTAIQGGLGSADLSVRGAAYADAQKILWEECPAVPLANQFNTFATSKRVTGLGRLKDGAMFFREGVYVG